MHLHQLVLRDFRNYEALQLTLHPGLVVFHGPNGAGKTNLLEAVHLTSTGESPRAREAAELVRFGQEHGFAGSRFTRAVGELKVDIGLARAGQRQVRVNGTVKRRADLIGLAPVVYFSADDIVVIKGEPSGRRRLLDTELSSLSRSYYAHLNRYRRALEQRNRLLKDLRSGQGRPGALDPWDRAAARYGARVMVERRDFLTELSAAAAEAHARLTGGAQSFLVQYRPSLASEARQTAEDTEKAGPSQGEVVTHRDQSVAPTAQEPDPRVEATARALEEALHAHRGADIGAGITLVGPHRDDFELLLGDRPVRAYGSQGQQRAGALALRLGLAAVAEKLTGERPVLLLDDVLSELDERYRAGVFEACRSAEQAMITSCDLADIPAEARAGSAVFEVGDGRIL
jgi:DNA replication and repair protein RecF